MPAPSTRNILPLLPAVEVAANYTVINGTLAQLSSFNAGGTTVDALRYKDNVSLTPTELAGVASRSGVIVTATVATSAEQLRKSLKRITRYAST